MSPGTDFSIYQKVASSTISNVPIDHSLAQHSPPGSSIERFLLGQADEQSKINAAEKHQQILSHERRIRSSNGQTCTMSVTPETSFTRPFEGDHKKARGESQKDNNGYVDILGDTTVSAFVTTLCLPSTLRAGPFDGDADGNAAFG